MQSFYHAPHSEELENRLASFRFLMNLHCPGWDSALIVDKVNQYYFTGTMQDALLIITKSDCHYFIRRSYERALNESPLPGNTIHQITSYRDIAKSFVSDLGNVYVETAVVTIEMLQRINKHFTINSLNSLDRTLFLQRSVKSEFELGILRHCGQLHNKLLTQIVPNLLREGITEAEFVAELFPRMIVLGYHGIARFASFQTDIVLGQAGFGVSSLMPTNFDGPGGARGINPAAPVLGSPDVKLKKGDLVFVDIAFGINGYHTDKTQVYSYGKEPDNYVKSAHNSCIKIMEYTASLLLPAAIPERIYKNTLSNFDKNMPEGFMISAESNIKFLGHGVGLHIDEHPIIANGFKTPLEIGNVIALEPKSKIKQQGTVGVEETFEITSNGAKCLTGGPREIIKL